MLNTTQWIELVLETDWLKRDKLLANLWESLDVDGVDELVSEMQGPSEAESALAREVLYRLYYEKDPRFLGNEPALSRWRKHLFKETYDLWWSAPPSSRQLPTPAAAEATLHLDLAVRVPVRGGGFAELGPGAVPYSLSIAEVWRAEQPSDESDKISFMLWIAGTDGAAYCMERDVSVATLFHSVNASGVYDSIKDAEVLAERLAIRVDSRERIPAITLCAGRILQVCYWTKHAYFKADLLVVRGGPFASGGRSDDRIAMRVLAHAVGGLGGAPLPTVPIVFRSLAAGLLMPSAHFAWVDPAPDIKFTRCSGAPDGVRKTELVRYIEG